MLFSTCRDSGLSRDDFKTACNHLVLMSNLIFCQKIEEDRPFGLSCQFDHSGWGVTHKISSAYYPRANERTKLAVKTDKRLVTGSLGPQGIHDIDQFARALLKHRTTPEPPPRTQPSPDHIWQWAQQIPPSSAPAPEESQPQREGSRRPHLTKGPSSRILLQQTPAPLLLPGSVLL